MTLLIGADPELFLKDSGKFVSAYGLIPGNKYSPHPVTDGAIQVDGTALEFNIKPASNKTEFVHHIDMVMAQLRNMVPKQYEMVVEPWADFGEDYLSKQPPLATELGCDADFNAYTMTTNPMPRAHPSARCAGGHVHLGWCEGADPWSEEHFEYCALMARQLDFYLGLPSVLLDHDNRRREMYGKAGAFRPKHYGMEYRVLSNFWIKSPEFMNRVYDNAQMAYDSFTQGYYLNAEYPNEAQAAINTNNIAKALKLCQDLEIPAGIQ